MNRTVFLIDGFNLYHSVRQASDDLGGRSTRWLDIDALCKSYLHTISKDARLEGTYYFSALAHHLTATNPDTTKRHEAFIECLEETGVEVELARFKRKKVKFRVLGDRGDYCAGELRRYEEKETDVAIAVKLLELLFTDSCDTAMLVTGDTDLAPAVRAAQRLFPEKDVRFAFPYRRHNKELKDLAPKSFIIGSGSYSKHQFADPFVLSDGRKIDKPSHW